MFKSLILIIISMVFIIGILTLIYFTPVTVVLITISFIATILFAYYKYIEKDDKFANAGLTFFLPFTATLFVLYNQFPILLQESVYKKIGTLFVIIIFLTIFSLNKEIKKGEKSFLEKWGSSFITILIFVFIWSLYSDNTIESYFRGESSSELFKFIGGNKTEIKKESVIFDLSKGQTRPCKYIGDIRLNFDREENLENQKVLITEYKGDQIFRSYDFNGSFSYTNGTYLVFSAPNGCRKCNLYVMYNQIECK